MVKDVQEVAAAVVREYLSRKGLKKTIACMDEEFPRTNSSINNRSELCRVLHLESLYKKNKCDEQPMKTMLEIMTKERMKKGGDVRRHPSQTDQSLEKDSSKPPSEPASAAPSIANDDDDDYYDDYDEEDVRKAKSFADEKRGSRMRKGIMAGPVAATSQKNEKVSAGMQWKGSGNTDASRTKPEGSNTLERERLRVKNESSSPKLGALHMAGLVLDDFEDQDFSCGLSGVNNVSRHHDWNKHPMEQKTATALKEIIFGSPMSCFSEEWRCQNFTFSNRPTLRYGIVQKKGGPCGVLAAVQATVLKKLLFEETSSDALSERLSSSVRTRCLTDAVAEILWRATDKKNVTVAINSGRCHFTPIGHYRSDGILEMITCVEVQNFDDLKLLIEQHIHQFESGPFGCILLIVSAVLSRTIPMVKGDMDVPTSTLIGAHGYCTQELVNLLLCGCAVSNVFDNEMKLDSGNGNFTLLKGIRERCDIGLLSLYEHYNICTVGSYLKNPKFPIWMVCSESHFSILFSLCEDLTSGFRCPKEFDLHYYDGLANQQEAIRLTVYSSVKALDAEDMDSDLTPPLELCIRTRWTDAAVSWNDSEPIL
ncbi:putative ubiquitin carboxyl-terminal hydrolase MINDY-4 [Silurus asotus]|uniref:Ubiquitin carboxyl-terminal hydrolase MINDY n=1 Tax=Silurus asotus TaxID=30991 RepID=A0AAD5A5Y4_SILAS|nr:putative ubiquitin carboxyl-terminal hydrolase MINDY-4 [Silurus asotus]